MRELDIMKGIAYSELKKDKRAYEIMTLRDQNGDTFTDIAKRFMISSARARQIYNRQKFKQISLYISHIAEVYNDDSQVKRVYERAENCYRNHTYACAYLEKEYRDILDEYREGEPGMPEKFIKSMPPLKTTHKEKTLSRIAEMREAEKATFAKIGKEMRMTPERVKYVYDCYRSVKGIIFFDNTNNMEEKSMENSKKQIGMHLDPVIHQKLKAIAVNEGRSMSEQVRIFIKDYIRKFEEKNGEIEIRPNEQDQK